jgi:hypothetical protein
MAGILSMTTRRLLERVSATSDQSTILLAVAGTSMPAGPEHGLTIDLFVTISHNRCRKACFRIRSAPGPIETLSIPYLVDHLSQ